ncbi:methyltransferase [Geodermatophilus sp. URMC 64]
MTGTPCSPGLTADLVATALAGYPAPGGRTVAEIGGAALVSAVLAHDPDPRRLGIVFDRPHVVPATRARLVGSPLADRIGVIGGDYLAVVPAADTYLLSLLRSDWDDEACRLILGTIAAAARPGARLVALEVVDPPGEDPLPGRGRSTEALERLLGAAGFRVDAIRPTASPVSIVEATLT